ncbi:MAG: sugar phosphate isomerase/epimerase [Candidatus Latescibacterota bacterium]|jgi:sugar phosphate isomerase/epimerase
MSSVKLTGFADEIDADPQVQIEILLETGVKFLELRGVGGKGVLDLDAGEAQAFKRDLDAAGIGVSAIGSPIGKVQVRSDLDAHFARFEIALERARQFETNYVRIFSFYCEDEEAASCRERVMGMFRRMVDAAAAAGLTLLHENESDIYGDVPTRCVDLFETMNSPVLRAAFDPANFIQVGVDPLNDAWPRLASYSDYFHIKDALSSSRQVVPAGYGDGGIEEILRQAIASGFDGFLSIEPHLKADDPVHGGTGPERFSKAVTALRTVLDKVGVEAV